MDGWYSLGISDYFRILFGFVHLSELVKYLRVERYLAAKIGPVTAEKILPGARSYEDIQKYLDSVKKEKLEKLKGQSKDFSKFSGRRW